MWFISVGLVNIYLAFSGESENEKCFIIPSCEIRERKNKQKMNSYDTQQKLCFHLETAENLRFQARFQDQFWEKIGNISKCSFDVKYLTAVKF